MCRQEVYIYCMKGLACLLLFFSVTAFGQSNDAAQDSVLKSIADNMVPVEMGTFTMGCTAEQGKDCTNWEKPSHVVMVNSFYMGRYDVTQAQWDAVMGKDNDRSKHKNCPNCPVDNVSWNDAIEFINRLNELTGKKYRLPTEAEWEYAARGGNKSQGYKYAGSNEPDRVEWYDGNSKDTTHPVGYMQPNELGLFDMNGNVWQWCSDWFDEKYYATRPADNPKGPDHGTERSIRGGSWVNYARVCRVSYRIGTLPSKRFSNDGFRLAMDY
jgi:formylglycine-generating enzyme required for sulfatase activity